MKRNTYVRIICIMMLCILFFVGCTTYSEEVYKVNESFSSIEINDTEAGIMITASSDGKCRVVVDERSNGSVYHTVKVVDEVLKVDRCTKGLDWIIGGSFKELLVEVQVPVKDYKNLSASSVSGRIKVENGLSFDSVNLNSTSGSVTFSAKARNEIVASTTSGFVTVKTDSSLNKVDCKSRSGRVAVSDVKAKTVNVKNTSGSIVLDSVIASDSITLHSTTGSIRLERCDGGDINIESTSGSVKGSLLSNKIFKASSYSGRVNVPSSFGTNTCYVKTTSGSIVMSIV